MYVSSSALGSSPRVRGAAQAVDAAVGVPGTIPACAGSRAGAYGSSAVRRDHPPRMRGAVPPDRHGEGPHGVIPARAGSRAPSPRTAPSPRDHPRACGEQADSLEPAVLELGSSPRVRGAVLASSRTRQRSGIIPARAGSRLMFSSGNLRNGDHPRACGEQFDRMPCEIPTAGSSPRVRGAAETQATRLGGEGIIPARAGSSLTKQCKVSATRDHPRACGEQ